MTHRWISLVLGLILVLITTSGAVLVYLPEVQRWLNSDAYAATGGPAVVTLEQAEDAVAQAHPDFVPSAVIAENGVLRVTDFEQSFTVDPSTGALLGEVATMPTWLGWTENLHECLLSCEGEPGYIEALTTPVPGTNWLGYEGEPVTVGGLILGIFGLLLLFLALSGLWLWWPRPGRYKASMSVRTGKGRFARDTDLHKVIGMVALPLLLLWGFTGAGFELTPVEDIWYALTPGMAIEAPEVQSADGDGPDIGVDAAGSAALALLPAATLVAVVLPEADDPTATYTAWLADGIDPYAHSDFPGDAAVAIDRRTGEATITSGTVDESVAQHVWEMWNFPVHTGVVVNGWWRSIWFVLGLAPLALAVTGVSTWLYRRKTKRERRARQAVSAVEAAPAAEPATAGHPPDAGSDDATLTPGQ